MSNTNPDRAAILIRAKLAADFLKQKDIAKELDINKDLLNKFLRRKINLLDSDIEKILLLLGLEKFETRLSTSADVIL